MTDRKPEIEITLHEVWIEMRFQITGSPAGLSRVNGAERCSAGLAIMQYFQNDLTRSVLNGTS